MPSEEKNESNPKLKFQLLSALFLFTILFGATFYHYVEDLTWLDSVYFCVITLTTVGYGDITPQTEGGKLFTIFYVLSGLGIIFTFANTLAQNVIEKREVKLLEGSSLISKFKKRKHRKEK